MILTALRHLHPASRTACTAALRLLHPLSAALQQPPAPSLPPNAAAHVVRRRAPAVGGRRGDGQEKGLQGGVRVWGRRTVWGASRVGARSANADA